MRTARLESEINARRVCGIDKACIKPDPEFLDAAEFIRQTLRFAQWLSGLFYLFLQSETPSLGIRFAIE